MSGGAAAIGSTPPPVDPDAAVELRGAPPRVMRLSRKAVAIVGAGVSALIGSALIFALQPQDRSPPNELYNVDGAAVADRLAAAPSDYSAVPKLGPPLPGDLGKPILDAQQRGDIADIPPLGTPATAAPPDPAADAAANARARALEERDSARTSDLFFANSGATKSSGSAAPPTDGLAQALDGAGAAPASREPAFLDRASDQRIASAERLTGPASPGTLQAGAIIPAALITGVRSDLPGLVIAQVTQNIYDSATGRHLLIPQGARLIGDYDAEVGFGQRRVLLAWNRLILPDGRSLVLERLPASDRSGFAGLEDGVDHHWDRVFKAALVSTLLGFGAEIGSDDDDEIVRALRRGGQDSVGRAGDQIVSRELDIRPTLRIRPGFPLRILVTRDIVLDEDGFGR